MKRVNHLVAAALVVAACSETGQVPAGPGGPEFELRNVDQRIDGTDVNAWVFGSFQVSLDGGPATLRVLGANGVAEEASFPGIGVFYGGYCVYGKWYNPKGKPTSGTLDRPHPHCLEYAPGEAITVILEPISATYDEPGGTKQLRLGQDDDCGSGDDLKIKFVRAGSPSSGYSNSQTDGCGLIDAWGIDVTTLAGTKTRVGSFSFDLENYDTDKGIPSESDLFDVDCGGVTDLNGLTVSGCLGKQITATFTAPDGTTQQVTGYLYWEMSSRTNTFFNSN